MFSRINKTQMLQLLSFLGAGSAFRSWLTLRLGRSDVCCLRVANGLIIFIAKVAEVAHTLQLRLLLA